jgi:hypothetical protein
MLGERAARSGLRASAALLAAGRDLERHARRELGEALDSALVATLDAVSERVLSAAFRGRVVEETVEQLLASEALWELVDEIARSPSVTEAIAHQGSGFLDQVSERLRERSRAADARVQEIADRLPGHGGTRERPR